MSDPFDPGSNPFATRFIRPGAIPYVFPAGISAESLIDNLAAQRWRGAIIGPHGTGKSSLLAVLTPGLAARGREIVQQQLRGGENQVRWQELNPAAWGPQTLVIIDGYEQLSPWQRLLLRARCRLRGTGLLVTAHEPVGLTPIYVTEPSVELAQVIVQKLLPAHDERIAVDDITREFNRCQGNVREMLLGLFDVYRARQGQV